jgi:Ca2+-transporting ATPase
MRRDPTSGLAPPVLSAVKLLAIPAGLVVLCTELPFLQRGLLAESLSGMEWLACIGLALVLPLVVEADKWIRRRRDRTAEVHEVESAVAPARAVTAPG